MALKAPELCEENGHTNIWTFDYVVKGEKMVKVSTMVWSNEQVEKWRLLRNAYAKDRSTVTNDKDIDLRRPDVQGEMMHLLRSFLDGKIALKAFNAVFQQKTHNASNVFHLRGMSGGLFLNKLVKYVPSEDTFGHLLRLMVRVPEGIQDGRRQMQAFVRFLEGLIASGQITRAQLQPARVPFFLSAWWHIQDPEQWPVFYLDVRQAILTEETRSATSQDPIEAYFAFRTRFLDLAQTLSISSWELEHLASWHARRNPKEGDDGKAQASSDISRDNYRAPSQKLTCVLARKSEAKNGNVSDTQGKVSGAHTEECMVSCRTHLQWLLAKLGHKVGCRVWIAANDHGKECQQERLGSLSLPSLPVLADASFEQIILPSVGSNGPSTARSSVKSCCSSRRRIFCAGQVVQR